MVAVNYKEPRGDGEHLAALMARNELLSIAIEAGNVGIWEWEPESGCLLIHPVLMNMLGLGTSGRVIGIKQWLAHVHPHDRSEVRRALDRFLQAEQAVYQHCHRMLRQDGDIFYVLSRARMVPRPSGQPIRIIGAEIDITDALFPHSGR